MKAQDFFVSAWVAFYNENQQREEYAQVTGIHADTYPGLCHVQTSDSDVFYDHRIYKPIELIPQMLTDNGFKPVCTAVSSTPVYWEYYDGDVKISAHPNTRTPDKGFFVAITNGKVASYAGYIRYVNELQQALRICKVNIDIKL